MSAFVVVFHVDEKKLPTVLGVIEGNAKLISVTSVTEPEAEKPKLNRDQHYVGGKRFKGISGEDLALQILEKAGRPVSKEELMNGFVERGFAGNSYSPSLHALTKKGKVVSAGPGKWALKGTLIHLGAGQK